MADAKRDANRVTTILGISDTDGVTLVPIHSDPVTGRLLMDITIVTDVGSANPQFDKRDADRRPTHYGVADNAALTVLPLVVDPRNNYLYTDVLTE